MNPAILLLLEGRIFLILLAGTLAWMMLTRRIAMDGLFLRADGAVSPERVQLLVTTLAVSAHLLFTVMSSKTVAMPDVDPQWLYVFGGSGGIYAGVKAATMMGRREPGGKGR